MLVCCGQADPREIAKWRAELCLLAAYFPSHRALKLGVGGANKGRGREDGGSYLPNTGLPKEWGFPS